MPILWPQSHSDFNLSKLLEEARPESSLTSAAGATNPIWLVGGGRRGANARHSGGPPIYLLRWRLPPSIWCLAGEGPACFPAGP